MVLSPRHQIHRSFSNAATSYEGAAQHQYRVAETLVEYCKAFIDLNKACINTQNLNSEPAAALSTKVLSAKLLDLGSGTGFVGQHCVSKGIALDIVNLDLCESMLKYNKSKDPVCADIQSLPFKDECFDLCVSSYAFQWSSSIDNLFAEIFRILKPGGKIFFSIPGEATFGELKEAWSQVDRNIHVHQFLSDKKILSTAFDTGLKALHFSVVEDVLEFPNQRSCLQHIKNIGAHNLDLNRPKHLLGKRRYQKFSQAFREQSKVLPNYSLSYQSYYIGLYKPVLATGDKDE